MKVAVTGRHLTVSASTRADISRKLKRLERLLNDSAMSTQCVITREKQHFVCEMTVHARGDHMLHGVGEHAKLPLAIAGAAQKVTQQAQRLSDKWKTRRRAGRGRRTDLGGEAAPVSAGPRIIRSRGATVRPMSLDDAVLALTADGSRPFVVFRHAATDEVAVLFKRPDGHYGLIEPGA